MEKIIIGMATFPPRKAGMLETIRRLLPQCDVMHVYMNGYTAVPPEMPKSPKLDLILAGPGCQFPDMGSHGKFYWAGDEPGFYCSVDDDILYPPDYIAKLVAGCAQYGRKAIVGFHGGRFRVGNGQALPDRGFTRDMRTLYGYSNGYPMDQNMHTLGAGVMCSYPTAIGLTPEAFNSPVGSGDDEDVALFAQQHNIPMIRLACKEKWIMPNNTQWMIEALHRRMNYIKGGDDKIKRWRTWRLVPIPATHPIPATVTPAVKPPVITGPSFDKVLLSPEDLAFTDKIMSSDALAAQLVTRIKQRIPTSVIRMSDGERAIIEYAQKGTLTGFLKDPVWLKRYGLMGVDLKQVGRDLLWAGEQADYLACTISGIFWGCFRVHQYFPQRTRFIDQFFPQAWVATDRLGAILRAGPVLVLHREHDKMCSALASIYGLTDITGIKLDSWRDHAGLLNQIPQHHASTVLLSGGASGKPFAVRLAQASGKVVIDAGEGLGRIWTNPEYVTRAGGKLP